MNYKEEHINSGYFAKVTKMPHLRGLLVELPRNIFMRMPALKLMYVLDDNKLDIYKDGSKSESIDCPEYALRYLVSTDVTINMLKRRMDIGLSRGFDTEGNRVSSEEDKIALTDMILPSKNPQTRKLEYIFSNAMTEFQENQGQGRIPESVIDGFEIVIKRYVKGTQK